MGKRGSICLSPSFGKNQIGCFFPNGLPLKCQSCSLLLSSSWFLSIFAYPPAPSACIPRGSRRFQSSWPVFPCQAWIVPPKRAKSRWWSQVTAMIISVVVFSQEILIVSGIGRVGSLVDGKLIFQIFQQSLLCEHSLSPEPASCMCSKPTAVR